MPIRIVVNGREVQNPHVKRLLAPMVLLMVFMMMALVMFVLLPLIGLAVGVGLALAATGAGTVLIGVPIARVRARMRAPQSADGELNPAMEVRQSNTRSELPESRHNDTGHEETF